MLILPWDAAGDAEWREWLATPAGALRHAPRDKLHAASPAPPHNALAEDAHHPPDAPAPTPKLDLIG